MVATIMSVQGNMWNGSYNNECSWFMWNGSYNNECSGIHVLFLNLPK